MSIRGIKAYSIIAILLIAARAFATSSFPGAVDTTGAGSLGVAVPGVSAKSANYNTAMDAIIQLETKVGIGVTANPLHYLLINPASINPGHVHTGASLSALNAATITSGTVGLGYGGTGASLTLAGAGYFLGSNGASVVFTNDGGGLTNLSAAQITAGTLPDARLSANVVLKNANVIPTVDNSFDLGSTAFRWKTLHLGPGSLVVHNDATDTQKVSFLFSGSTAKVITDATTSALVLTTGANTGIVVLANGKVGINNGAATEFLDVTGNIKGSGTLSLDSGGITLARVSSTATLKATGGNDLQLTTTGNDGITVAASGSTGVGDTTPTEFFVVGNGDKFRIDSSGNIVRVNNVVQSWPGVQGGVNTLLQNNGSGILTWVPGGSFGAVWSALTDPVADLTLSHGSNKTTFAWGATTSTFDLFNLTDTTGNTGTGYLVKVFTASGSTLKPFYVGAAGIDAITVDASAVVSLSTTLPFADNTKDLGSSSFSWRTLYADTSVLSPLFSFAGALSITTTASNGDITLDANGVGSIIVSDLFKPSAHNTIDLGIAATAEFRTGYFATSVRTPLLTSVGALSITSAASGDITLSPNGTGVAKVTKDSDNLPISGSLHVRTTVTTVTNTAAETDLTTKTLAGAPSAGRVYHLWTGGSFTNDATPDQTQYRVYIGGTVVCDTTVFTAPTSLVSYTLDVILTVRTAGSSGVVQCSGSVFYELGNEVARFNTNTTAIDLDGTPAVILKTTVQFSGAGVPSTNDEINEETAIIEVLN